MRIFTALLALALWAFPASAHECQPLAKMLRVINERAPIAVYVHLDAMQTAAVVDWFNRQPPESDERFDLAVIVRHQDGRFGIVFGEGDLACAGYIVPPELMDGLAKAIAGERA